MDQTAHDRTHMQRALELARRGIGLTSPNPAVGCVLVDRDGQVIGEGWHEFDRRDHAEIAALKAARQHSPERIAGATAYVTLEPCNHTGRTGPCSRALVDAGVGRVVAATIDPNPLVAGQGMETLRSAGIETTVGLCQDEARRLNDGFAHWIQHRRPFVHMKVAMTLDGRIAPAPGTHPAGTPFWITNELSRAAVQQLRHQADAVLTGIDTVLADDPLLTDRSGLPRRRPLLRVVLDSALRLPLDGKLAASTQDDLLVFTVSSDQARAQALRERGIRVEVLPSAHGHVPLEGVLNHLGAENILTLLTETGSRLNTALLSAELVNRLQIFQSPQLLGSDAVPAFRALERPVCLPDALHQHYGDDISLCSLLLDPWQKQ